MEQGKAERIPCRQQGGPAHALGPGGGYSFVLSLIVLAILVAVNVLAQALPTKWTQFDISAAQLYSLTSDTKAVVTNLQQDVTIYWITQAGEEDLVVEKLLQRYSELSSHITVVKKEPGYLPHLCPAVYLRHRVQQLSGGGMRGKYRHYIGYEDIYQYDAMSCYTTGSACLRSTARAPSRRPSAMW